MTSDDDIPGISKTIHLSEIDQETAELNVSKYVVKEFVDDTPPYDEVLQKLRENNRRIIELEAEIDKMIMEGGFLNE